MEHDSLKMLVYVRLLAEATAVAALGGDAEAKQTAIDYLRESRRRFDGKATAEDADKAIRFVEGL